MAYTNMYFHILKKIDYNGNEYIKTAYNLLKERNYFIEEKDDNFIVFSRTDKSLEVPVWTHTGLYMAQNGRIELAHIENHDIIRLDYSIVVFEPCVFFIAILLLAIFVDPFFFIFAFIHGVLTTFKIINVQSEMKILLGLALNK
jgi:hypothetical protein